MSTLPPPGKISADAHVYEIKIFFFFGHHFQKAKNILKQ